MADKQLKNSQKSKTEHLKEYQWKKGQSGNPKGRKPKEKCLTELMRQMLNERHPTDDKKRTWLQMIVEATLRLAMKGNATALREVWERMDGKIPLDVDMESEDTLFIISEKDLPKPDAKK